MSEKVLLVYGGFSAEREVSLSSKNDIAYALKNKGYTVIEHNLTDVWAFLDILKPKNLMWFTTVYTATGVKMEKFKGCLICCKFLIPTQV